MSPPAPCKLYIAASLDGYIAREDDGLDWLDALPNPDGLDHGYAEFYAGIDLLVMGRRTYEVVLGMDVDWPYADRKTYVATRQADYAVPTPRTEVLGPVNAATLAQVRAESRRGVWVVGGGALLTAFLDHDALDEMILCLFPVVLGGGIPLFPGHPKETAFEPLGAKVYPTGLVVVNYRRKATTGPVDPDPAHQSGKL